MGKVGKGVFYLGDRGGDGTGGYVERGGEG